MCITFLDCISMRIWETTLRYQYIFIHIISRKHFSWTFLLLDIPNLTSTQFYTSIMYSYYSVCTVVYTFVAVDISAILKKKWHLKNVVHVLEYIHWNEIFVLDQSWWYLVRGRKFTYWCHQFVILWLLVAASKESS